MFYATPSSFVKKDLRAFCKISRRRKIDDFGHDFEHIFRGKDAALPEVAEDACLIGRRLRQ